MSTATRDLWNRFREFFYVDPDSGLSLDVSRIHFPEGYFRKMAGPVEEAFRAMEALEAGEIANPDEDRCVGHYWLRAPELAPTDEIAGQIRATRERIERFAADVQLGVIRPQEAERFTRVLSIGIGGSALGPQLLDGALRNPGDPLKIHFFDNTDPDGYDRVLAEIGGDLHRTLVLVISKSGGTRETRNGMVEARHAYERCGLDFHRHAVAVTQEGSALDRQAESEGWLARFPLWDWVGGRTSLFSAVGLLPAALQGFNVPALCGGAAHVDRLTRVRDARRNPAMLLALAWHAATGGRGEKDMVVLPYCDRLELFPRYLQQLVMESLGKEKDLGGRVVHQGITVYGNKGSTDQHAYVQQLRDGVPNFFVTFIAVLRDRSRSSPEVEEGVTAGDYLSGFWQGTREALWERGRESITVTVPEIGPRALGQLVALYERAVGFYASLVGINAYHQPGVEAGKRAAAEVLEVQRALLKALRQATAPQSVEELARAVGRADRTETVFHVLRHLAANPRFGVEADGLGPWARFRWRSPPR